MNLKKFKSWMRGEALSEVTINNYLRYLRQIEDEIDLDEVEENYEIADFLAEFDTTFHQKNNIAKAINKYLEFREIDYKLKLKSHSGQKDIWVPSKEQVEKILQVRCWGNKYHNEKNHLYLRTTVEAGLRIGEAQELRFQNIRRIKKEGKTKHLIDIIDSKGNKDRSVPISKALYDKLMRFDKYYASSDVVFANSDGNPLSVNTLRGYCYEAAEATEDQDLIDNLSPHKLRHYRTIELHRNGLSAEAIKRFLGHSKLSTTQRYLKGDRDLLYDEMEKKDRRYSERGESMKNPFLLIFSSDLLQRSDSRLSQEVVEQVR